MPLCINLVLLFQAILYFASFVCGFLVSIPVGVTKSKFQGLCLLYLDIQWTDNRRFTYQETSESNCDFPIVLSVLAGILYALGMGIFYCYLLHRKVPIQRSKLWVFIPLFLNSLVTLLFLISACMISVGFKTFCDSVLKDSKQKRSPVMKGGHYLNDGENFDWSFSKLNKLHFYTNLQVAQSAAWIMFFIWIAQAALHLFVYLRDRRQRETDENSSNTTVNHVNTKGRFVDSGLP